jgi:glyoxylase-like metal-dependent hydrolase (beta-lactamase superfamily II)
MPTEVATDVYEISAWSEDGGKDYRVFLFAAGTPTLVDTGKPDTASAIIDGIEAVGVEPERVVITHGDGDHVGGFDAVVDRFAPETWVPEGTDLDAESTPTHWFSDGDRIGRFVAVHTPGHEPEHHVVIDEPAGIAVMGDAANGSDRRGLPPGYFTLPSSSTDLDQALESLRKLLDYDFDVGLVFHGSSVMEDARDKLDRYVNPV